jgi:hypothetical protein
MQSLDNVSADPMQVPSWVAREHLNEMARRQEAVRLIDEVTVRGPTHRSVDERVAVFQNEWSFVLEIVPTDRDAAGRASPVVSHGRVASIERTIDGCRAVVAEIAEFCDAHDRAPLESDLRREASSLLLKALTQENPKRDLTSDGKRLLSKLRKVIIGNG